MADSSISVRIGANIEDARAGFRAANDHVDGLVSHLREFKSEAVSTGRTARFFAADLAEIIPGAEGARGAIQGVLAAMLSGGGFAAAFEGVRALVGILHALGAEEEKAAQEAKKFAEDSATSIENLRGQVEKLLFVMSGATRAQILAFETTRPMREKDVELQEKLRAAQEALAASQRFANTVDEESADIAAVAVRAGEKRVEQIKAEIAVNRARIAEANTSVGPLAGADAAKAAREIALAESVEEAKRQAAQETERNAINLAVITTQQEEQKAGEEADFKEALEREIQDAKRRNAQETEDSAINLARIETEQDDALQKQQKTLNEHKQLWKEIRPEVSHLAADMAQMLIDGKSLDDVLKDIANQILKSAIQFAIQGAFGLGPLAFAQGGDVPSAAGGWDVPSSGGGIPAVLHAREMVLPEKYAEVIRDAANGGGGGGVTVQINGVIDGDHLMRVVHSRQFADAMKSARRMGRLP